MKLQSTCQRTVVINNYRLSLVLCASLALVWCPRLKAQVDRPPGLLQDLVDVSADFHEYRNTYFLADKLTGFDPATGAGAITWARHQLSPRIAFSNMENVLRPFDGVTFPCLLYTSPSPRDRTRSRMPS